MNKKCDFRNVISEVNKNVEILKYLAKSTLDTNEVSTISFSFDGGCGVLAFNFDNSKLDISGNLWDINIEELDYIEIKNKDKEIVVKFVGKCGEIFKCVAKSLDSGLNCRIITLTDEEVERFTKYTNRFLKRNVI